VPTFRLTRAPSLSPPALVQPSTPKPSLQKQASTAKHDVLRRASKLHDPSSPSLVSISTSTPRTMTTMSLMTMSATASDATFAAMSASMQPIVDDTHTHHQHEKTIVKRGGAKLPQISVK
jgi:hypothetical protein